MKTGNKTLIAFAVSSSSVEDLVVNVGTPGSVVADVTHGVPVVGGMDPGMMHLVTHLGGPQFSQGQIVLEKDIAQYLAALEIFGRPVAVGGQIHYDQPSGGADNYLPGPEGIVINPHPTLGAYFSVTTAGAYAVTPERVIPPYSDKKVLRLNYDIKIGGQAETAYIKFRWNGSAIDAVTLNMDNNGVGDVEAPGLGTISSQGAGLYMEFGPGTYWLNDLKIYEPSDFKHSLQHGCRPFFTSGRIDAPHVVNPGWYAVFTRFVVVELDARG